MRKKLFFDLFSDAGLLSVRLPLLLLFFLPIFLMASQKQKDNHQKNSVQKNSSAIIFVGEGADVVGFSNFHKAKIVKASSAKRKESKKAKDSTFSDRTKTALSQKKAKEKASKNQQEKNTKIDTKIDFSFNNSPLSNSDIKQKSGFAFQAVISSFSFSKNFAIATYFYQISKINTKLKKQKFYTSLSYLQFKKYRNSSLRAPPQFS